MTQPLYLEEPWAYSTRIPGKRNLLDYLDLKDRN